MTTQDRIRQILKQKNYSIVKGKVLRYDQLDDKFKPVQVSGNRIPLVKEGQTVEIFVWNDVEKVISDVVDAPKNAAKAIQKALQSNGKPPEAVSNIPESIEGFDILDKKVRKNSTTLTVKAKEAVVDNLPIQSDVSQNVYIDENKKAPSKSVKFSMSVEPLPNFKGVRGAALFPSDVKPDTVNVDLDNYKKGIENRKVKSKKSDMNKEKTVRALKKVIKKVEKKKAIKPAKKITAPKKTSSKVRNLLTPDQIKFIKDEVKKKEKGMSAIKMGKKFNSTRDAVGFHVRKFKKELGIK